MTREQWDQFFLTERAHDESIAFISFCLPALRSELSEAAKSAVSAVENTIGEFIDDDDNMLSLVGYEVDPGEVAEVFEIHADHLPEGAYIEYDMYDQMGVRHFRLRKFGDGEWKVAQGTVVFPEA